MNGMSHPDGQTLLAKSRLEMRITSCLGRERLPMLQWGYSGGDFTQWKLRQTAIGPMFLLPKKTEEESCF